MGCLRCKIPVNATLVPVCHDMPFPSLR